MDQPAPSTARRRGRPPGPAAPARVEAVDRALLLLEAFAEGTPRLALSALAARAGLYPSTALRLAGSLVAAGHLVREGDGSFTLGPALLRLGRLYQRATGLEGVLRPALARLAAATGETAAFYRLQGGRRLCLFRQEAPRSLRFTLEEGALLPLDQGAAGHVLRGMAIQPSPLILKVRAHMTCACTHTSPGSFRATAVVWARTWSTPWSRSRS